MILERTATRIETGQRSRCVVCGGIAAVQVRIVTRGHKPFQPHLVQEKSNTQRFCQNHWERYARKTGLEGGPQDEANTTNRND